MAIHLIPKKNPMLLQMLRVSITCRTYVLLCIIAGLLLGACEDLPNPTADDEETTAKDYTPFTVNGFVVRWERETIKVLLPENPAVEEWSLALNQAFKDGINNTWKPLLDKLDIRIQYETSGPNDIQVIWTNDPKVLRGERVLGFAEFCDPNKYNPNRRIVLSTGLPGAENKIVPHDLELIRSAAAHEFGHMLGIWSHSIDNNDLMYPTLDLKNIPESPTLTTRDKATFRKLYELDADYDLGNVVANLNDRVPLKDCNSETTPERDIIYRNVIHLDANGARCTLHENWPLPQQHQH